MNLYKVNKGLEIFWWILAAVTFVLVTVMIVIEGWDKWGMWYIATGLALSLALVRRFLSNRLKKSMEMKTKDQSNKKGKN